MRSVIVTVSLLALAACQQAPKQSQPAANQNAAQPQVTEAKGVDRSHQGTPAPVALFSDRNGKDARLGQFAGRPLLVNLWATWCAPCVKELPTLDQLARGSSVKVVAVSQDDGPHASVVAFLQEHGIATLEPYQDPKMALSGALGPDTVLPTSILYDANGKEVWRYVGDLNWASPEAAKLLSEGGQPATP